MFALQLRKGPFGEVHECRFTEPRLLIVSQKREKASSGEKKTLCALSRERTNPRSLLKRRRINIERSQRLGFFAKRS